MAASKLLWGLSMVLEKKKKIDLKVVLSYFNVMYYKYKNGLPVLPFRFPLGLDLNFVTDLQ